MEYKTKTTFEGIVLREMMIDNLMKRLEDAKTQLSPEDYRKVIGDFKNCTESFEFRILNQNELSHIKEYNRV